ncbi:MAG TPA: stage III sporulation protein AF [Halanaerobiaceae bacterium]|nr:stage III sporulation protein AF [Bacillota bacterium]HHU92878.1 stage III sporulation protein AF [Halanaerobiaceae bacterium]HOA41312.1 stage III sporulation protein AF [Halanaerobiales bacterium]HPZ63500.1 stage III sporulation protein AF [Halanaerobiales bacterium]HQD03959.1 stage III sporulation protein AF [Halanaerobiales bacterium]
MSAIINWVKNLIFIILFTALLEMFLPESNMGKYVRIVMGFFIISILLQPITAIFRQDYNQLQYIVPEGIISANWQDIQERGKRMEEANQTVLMNYYQEEIGKRVREIVSLYFADYQQDIKISLDEDYRIESLQVVLTETGIRPVEIKAVEIGREAVEERVEVSKDNRINKERLEYSLSQFLQISADKVQVVFTTGGK